MNTEIADPDGIVTITANQFILGAGTYFIRWSAPAAAGIDYNTFIYRHQSRLYDVTGTAEVEPGSPEYLGFYGVGVIGLSLIHLLRCRPLLTCKTRWAAEH